ncbi:MAG: hypothetical protein KIS91_05215 [Anaerolineae bacterium]|nr:hypothetical protein [Anaerolineae bacterium]
MSHEPVQVEARLEKDGRLRPIIVVWRGREQRVVEVGRQWNAERDGVPYRHVLVMLPNTDRLELALNLRDLTWQVVQTWTTPPSG